MYDLIFVLLIIGTIVSFGSWILYMFEVDFDYSWIVLSSVAFTILCYALYAGHKVPENFTIYKTEINIDSLKFVEETINIIFSETLRCEMTGYDLSMSIMNDYITYRIYIDSVDSSRYIDIIPTEHDTANYTGAGGKKLLENKKGFEE
jgi:hypothetical protein